MTVAFDHSGPVATVEFENSLEAAEREALIAEIRPTIIAEIRQQALRTIENYYQRLCEWAFEGRTLRARMIGLALLKGDKSVQDVAARFKLSENDVRKHRRELLKLRRRLFVEADESKSGVFCKGSRNLEVRRLPTKFYAPGFKIKKRAHE